MQLTAASERTTLDPFTEVDWDTPIDDRAFHLPPEWLPLYGTPVWDAMDEPTRISYSRHELAALCGAGIWFENRLMQIVLRHLAELPVTSPAHRYLLTEVADECRHSTMFGEVIRRAGTPPTRRRPTPRVRRHQRAARGPGPGLPADPRRRGDPRRHQPRHHEGRARPPRSRARSRGSTCSRRPATSASPGPTSPRSGPPSTSRSTPRWSGSPPHAVAKVAELMVDAAVYDELGIADGAALARTNPHHRARVVEGLAKVTTFLGELGVIDDDRRPEWRRLGLVA